VEHKLFDSQHSSERTIEHTGFIIRVLKSIFTNKLHFTSTVSLIHSNPDSIFTLKKLNLNNEFANCLRLKTTEIVSMHYAPCSYKN